MAEIVRLLRWRAEWDGAALVEGAEKAAAAGERVKTALEGVGAKGAPALKKAGAAAKEADTALEGLGYEAQQVLRYVTSLEKGAGSPLVLQRNAEQAEAAFNVLADAAGRVGKAIPEAFSDRVITAIQKGTTQAAAMNAELDKMGGQTPTKLDKVIGALERVAHRGSEAAATFAEMGQEGRRVADALDDLERAADSPIALQRAIARVKVETEAFRAALEKTPASAEKLKAVESAMGKVGTAISDATDRAAKLKNAQDEVSQSMSIMGKGAEKVGGSFGSLNGILGKMADSSSVASQKIAGVGFSVIAAGQAFSFGYEQGTKFNRFLQENGNYLEKAIDKITIWATGIKDISGDIGKLAADLDLEGAAITEHTKALAGQILARNAAKRATEEADAAVKAAIPGWESAASQQRKMSDEIDKVAKKFGDLVKNGGDWRAEVEANQGPLATWVKKLEEGKVKLDGLPPVLQDMIAHLKSLGAAAEESASGLDGLNAALDNIGNGDTTQSIKAVAEALDEIRAEGGDAAQAVRDNFDAMADLRREAEKSYETLALFRTEVMDQIPAYQATALAVAGIGDAVGELNRRYEEAAAARRAANEQDLQALANMQRLRDEAIQMAYAVDTIGEAWVRATGQAAGFTAEVRRATQQVEEADPVFDAFIEQLAGVSDEYERMIPYIGKLIADLERGDISVKEFNDAIAEMRAGFIQIQGMSGNMFGDIETEFNKLQRIINEFLAGKRKR